MTDYTKYVIEIYHNGVHFGARIRGKERYLKEKAFLAELTGLHHSSAAPPRPIPDPSTDFYMLTDEQLARYSEFRKGLAKAERETD